MTTSAITGVNLTKRAVSKCYTLKLTDDGQYVTNGAWAAARGVFKNAALLGSVDSMKALFPRLKDDIEEIPRDRMDMVVPRFSAPVTYRRSEWIRVHAGEESCLFTADDGSQVWLNRRIVELFGLDCVTGESTGGDDASLDPVMVGPRSEWSVIVMPMRLGFVKELA